MVDVYPDIIPPANILDKMRCGICNNHLSYFPIFLSAEGQNICGRCIANAEITTLGQQNEVYEAAAQFIKFPCRFRCQGCVEEFLPIDIVQHEKTCLFQVVSCPVKYCQWKGSYCNVIQHSHNQHCYICLQENVPFVLGLAESFERERLLVHDKQLFIIKLKFDVTSGLLQFAVCRWLHEIDTKTSSGRLNVKSAIRHSSVEFQTTDLADFDYLELCLEKMKDSIAVRSKISFDNLKEKINLDLLSALKCNKCGEFVMPPIYNHEDCVSCVTCLKKQVNIDTLSKNICLNNMASLVNYPCQYSKNGCRFVMKPGEMVIHQKFCQYEKIDCPFVVCGQCKWKNLRKSFYNHILSNHESYTLKNSQVITFSTADRPNSQMYYINFFNYVFRVFCWVRDDKLYWSVKLIDFPLADNFMYTLEIVDNELDIGLSIRQPYLAITNTDYQCYFYKDQLSRFVADNKIKYKVSIVKQALTLGDK